MSAAARRNLLARSGTIRVRKGQAVVARNEPTGDVLIVQEGRFNVVRYSHDGREVSLRELGENQLFGELSAIDGAARSVGIVAATDDRLLAIPPEAFRAAIRDHPDAADWLVRRLTPQVRSLTDRVFKLSALNVRAWLHCELLRLARSRDDHIENAPTHAELASCRIEQLLAFDIGQGSANALVCKCGQLVTYFDVSCGVYRNASTRPAQIHFCTHEPPTVILSHWDADHWAAATVDRRLLGLTWIAPRQSISASHTAFANAILELRRCSGSDRNGSGLALIIENQPSGRGWLLTGDASYDHVPGPIPEDLAAVVVPHHSANMGAASVPPASAHPGYARLIHSFGPDNAHGRTGIRHPNASGGRGTRRERMAARRLGAAARSDARRRRIPARTSRDVRRAGRWRPPRRSGTPLVARRHAGRAILTRNH